MGWRLASRAICSRNCTEGTEGEIQRIIDLDLTRFQILDSDTDYRGYSRIRLGHDSGSSNGHGYYTPIPPLSTASSGTAPNPCEELTAMKNYIRGYVSSVTRRYLATALFSAIWVDSYLVPTPIIAHLDSRHGYGTGQPHRYGFYPTISSFIRIERKTARKAILQDSQEIGIENQFSLLPNVIIKQVSGQLASSAAKNSESTTTANQNNRSNALPPPLMLKTDENYRVRIVRQTLIELGYRFYVITPKNERPIKVVIKGFPKKANPEEIKKDLEKKDSNPIGSTQLVGRRTKQLLPIFQVTLPRTIENLKIFDLKTLAHLNITVDGYNGRGVTQCFSCNNFHHNADNCYLKPRCLKCGEEHLTKDCPIKQRLETKFCINCQVYGHMANWYGCPCFPKPPKGTAKVNRNSYTNLYNSLIRPNLSYAQATTGKPATTNKKTTTDGATKT
ncbi:nucleic-acid-binding protein from transposon X-element [Trichonephila clavipes]|nr:nucleic-acid-binding protein from transposon X-element [Trichonephila clavipes]